MSKSRQEKESVIDRRIAKAEKKAIKYAGVDSSLIQRFWELVSMFPKMSTPELEERVECFIMNATPGQFFTMQQALTEEATPYLVEDERVVKLLREFAGRKLGLAIKGEYESTVTVCDCYLTVERGINENIPVLSVESRHDYADAILGLKDPVKLILNRRIRATHKLTLLKWALPHIDILRDRDLFDKYLSFQPEVERVLDETLKKMGY